MTKLETNLIRRVYRPPIPRALLVGGLVLAGMLMITACGSSDDDAFTGDEALAVSDDLIEAFNSGDADAVLVVLTPDVDLSERYTGPGSSFEAMERPFFEQYLAWSTAQGTTFTSPECAVTDDSSGTTVNVSCEFGWLQAAENAAGAPPVPTTLSLVVTTDGISQLALEYPPVFGVDSFDSWLLLNHNEDSQGVEFGDWVSVAEAQRGGTLRAQYVAEWAADLEANGG
ncbi:MAG: hypothetical protein ACR2PK_06445 [Acidimicrobiales bacterium]